MKNRKNSIQTLQVIMGLGIAIGIIGLCAGIGVSANGNTLTGMWLITAGVVLILSPIFPLLFVGIIDDFTEEDGIVVHPVHVVENPKETPKPEVHSGTLKVPDITYYEGKLEIQDKTLSFPIYARSATGRFFTLYLRFYDAQNNMTAERITEFAATPNTDVYNRRTAKITKEEAGDYSYYTWSEI
nr:MAG TPA: protein of unknown function (DUF4730) [Caudoviricetes sp.]